VLLTLLDLHWLVAAESVACKDDLTSQSLHKPLELQRTLWNTNFWHLEYILMIYVFSQEDPGQCQAAGVQPNNPVRLATQ
jgi:hypothetical protein